MRKLFFGAICLVALAGGFTPAIAEPCSKDAIRSVSASGAVVVMLSGAVFQVLPGDEIDAALWLPVSDVLVCERGHNVQRRTMHYFEIVNLGEDGEKVGATKLR